MQPRRVVRPNRVDFNRRPTAPQRKRPTINTGALKPLRSIAVAAVILFLGWSFFTIRTVRVEGNQFVSTETIQKLVDASFDRHPFSRNLLMLQAASLEKELPSADARLAEVDIVRQWPSGVLLKVTERKPSLGWKSGSQIYVLDAEGVAVGYQSDTSLKLSVIEDSTNLPIKIGDRVVPVRFVNFVTGLVTTMPKSTGLLITTLRVPDTTSELYVTTNKKYFIKFDTTRGVEEQLGDLKAVLDTLSKQKKTPAEYIDLRIAGKAYFK